MLVMVFLKQFGVILTQSLNWEHKEGQVSYMDKNYFFID
jgi:hypothetical protein